MTINQMRAYVLDFYPNASQKWRSKVLDMPTNQIVAIYKSILSRQSSNNRSEGDSKKEDYHQIDIWEFLASSDAGNEDVKGSHTDISVNS